MRQITVASAGFELYAKTRRVVFSGQDEACGSMV